MTDKPYERLRFTPDQPSESRAERYLQERQAQALAWREQAQAAAETLKLGIVQTLDRWHEVPPQAMHRLRARFYDRGVSSYSGDTLDKDEQRALRGKVELRLDEWTGFSEPMRDALKAMAETLNGQRGIQADYDDKYHWMRVRGDDIASIVRAWNDMVLKPSGVEAVPIEGLPGRLAEARRA